MAAPRRNVIPRWLAALAVALAVVAAPAGAPVAGVGPLAASERGGSDEREAAKDEERGGDDGGGAEGGVAPTAAYRVAVDCAYDAAGDRTTCAVAGLAEDGAQEEDGEGAKDVGFVVVPEDGVCADVVGGDHEHVDPDPNARVTGYKSRGNGGALTLVLAGEVGTGGEAIYWLKAGDTVHPAGGPGLRCGEAAVAGLVVSGPFPILAAILVEAAACTPVTPSATADWYEDCRDPVAGARFVLSVWDGARFVPKGTRTTDATGRLRFDRLPPGIYRLREDGTAWCHAESDSVDAAGDVSVRAGQEAHVWAFHCAAPGAATPPAK